VSSLPDRKFGSFQAEYRPLSESHADWGSIALLPWDEAAFGFPVAEFRLGPEPPKADDIHLFRETLFDFCRRTRSELISVRVPASDTVLIALLLQASFAYLDFSLLTTLPDLKPDSLPNAQFTLRQADPADHEAIYKICDCAFHFGRYHTDPRFPRELANRRYVQWMRRALSGSDPGDFVFVVGKPGKVSAFMHVALHESTADLRLGAAAPGIPVGFWLYAGATRSASALGAKTVVSGISAANIQSLQMFSALGFRFSRPEVILHWHSPEATHLVTSASVPKQIP